MKCGSLQHLPNYTHVMVFSCIAAVDLSALLSEVTVSTVTSLMGEPGLREVTKFACDHTARPTNYSGVNYYNKCNVK